MLQTHRTLLEEALLAASEAGVVDVVNHVADLPAASRVRTYLNLDWTLRA